MGKVLPEIQKRRKRPPSPSPALEPALMGAHATHPAPLLSGAKSSRPGHTQAAAYSPVAADGVGAVGTIAGAKSASALPELESVTLLLRRALPEASRPLSSHTLISADASSWQT